MPFEAMQITQPASTNPASAGLPQAPEATAPEASDKISPKLQILMRREKIALQREQAAKAKELDIENKYKSFSDREKKVQEFESLKQTNPLKALELLGLSYEDLTQIRLNDGALPADVRVQQVESKFDNYIKSQEAAMQRQAEETKRLEEKRNADTLENFKGQIGQYIKENGARYEFIEFEQGHDLVYDLIDEHYNRTLKAAQDLAREEGREPLDEVGEVMKTAEAADKVEQMLEQKYDKARSLSKIQALMGPRPGQETSTADKLKSPSQEPNKSQMPPTTNKPATPAPTQRSNKGILSDDERIARAIAYAKGLRP